MRHAISALIEDYSSNYGRSIINRVDVGAVVEYGIRNGYLALVEKRNIYTFGGVSVSLTDSELAEMMSLITANQPIAAIKKLRGITPIGLKEAKDFTDHLREILSKVNV